MLSYIISLLALPALCVLWIVFQNWLVKHDPDHQGYKAGCGGCTRSCGESDSDTSVKAEKTVKFIDASSVASVAHDKGHAPEQDK